MKRLSSLFMILIMLASLAACGKEGSESTVLESDAQLPIHLKVEFNDGSSNTLDGKYTIWTNDAESEGSYQLRFADENGIMDSYEAITKITLKAGEENAVSVTPFNSFNVAPEGAKSIVIAESETVHTTVNLPKNKINKKSKGKAFAVLSDTHMEENSKKTEDTLTKAFNIFNDLNAEHLCITGDVTDDGTESELSKFVNLLKASWTKPFYIVRGNHDSLISNDGWKEISGNDVNFSVEIDGVGYVFISYVNTSEVIYNELDNPFSIETIEWLEAEVTKYGDKNKPVFLFMHFPIPGQSGIKTNQFYGFKRNSEEATRIMELMKKYTMVVFSGHSHYDVSTQEHYEDMIVKKFADSNSYTVHIPSTVASQNIEKSRKANEGFIVHFHKNKLSIQTINFMNGRYLGLGCYEIDLKS